MNKRVNFAELAERCREMAHSSEIRDGLAEVLLEEVAEVLEHVGLAIEGMPAGIEAHRADAIAKTVHNIASVAEVVATYYLHGRLPISTAHGALRMFAASIRKAVQSKTEEAEKPLILQ